MSSLTENLHCVFEIRRLSRIWREIRLPAADIPKDECKEGMIKKSFERMIESETLGL